MIGQMNFATALAPLDHPIMSDFMANLDRINALAEASSGFVWRLKDDSGNATSIKIMTDPKAILNVSVWQTVADLHKFAYHTDHKSFVVRRDEWFVPTTRRSMALWSIEDDAPMPTAEEAFERLRYLEAHGPSPYAFDWASAKQFVS